MRYLYLFYVTKCTVFAVGSFARQIQRDAQKKSELFFSTDRQLHGSFCRGCDVQGKGPVIYYITHYG